MPLEHQPDDVSFRLHCSHDFEVESSSSNDEDDDEPHSPAQKRRRPGLPPISHSTPIPESSSSSCIVREWKLDSQDGHDGTLDSKAVSEITKNLSSMEPNYNEEMGEPQQEHNEESNTLKPYSTVNLEFQHVDSCGELSTSDMPGLQERKQLLMTELHQAVSEISQVENVTKHFSSALTETQDIQKAEEDLKLARLRRCEILTSLATKTDTLEKVDQRIEELVCGSLVSEEDYWYDVQVRLHSCMYGFATAMVKQIDWCSLNINRNRNLFQLIQNYNWQLLMH